MDASREVRSVRHTVPGKGHDVGDVLHEDASLELQAQLAPSIDDLASQTLFLLVGIDLLAAEQDPFEEVDLVLDRR